MISVHRTLRAAVLTATTAAVVAATLAAASPASAAPTNEIDYATTGSTTLTNPNSKASFEFAPTRLRSFVTFLDNGNATLTALLPLAPVKVSFKAFGFLPASGTAVFTQVGYVTGTLAASTFQLNATARYVVSLQNVVIGGARANVGSNCQTVRPITVKVASDPGFDLTSGTLTGTYDLGAFVNCGQGQTLINTTVPGKNNTLNLAINYVPTGSDATMARLRATAGTSN